ncbi:MAG: MoaD/ThiS family protein [Candidatus Hodarchaeota archaeon]
MPLQVRLYGDLKEKAKQQSIDVGVPITLNIEDKGIKTVLDVLKKLIIEKTEISHIFVNGKYSEIGRRIRDGDRVGLFPRRMALMFLEIAIDKFISVKIQLDGDLREYGLAETVIEIPEGSTLKSLLKKYKFSKDKNNIKIKVNEKPCSNVNFVLRDGDIVTF